MSIDERGAPGEREPELAALLAAADLQLVGHWEDRLRRSILAEDNSSGLQHIGPDLDEVAADDVAGPRRSSRLMLIAAAFVFVVGIGMASYLSNQRGQVGGADLDSSTSAGDVQNGELFDGPVGPGPVVDRFIDRFNNGDHSEAVALFSEDAVLLYGDTSGNTFQLTSTAWESLLVFYTTQEAEITDVVCATESDTTIQCRWQLHDAVTVAADRPGDEVEVTFTVVDQRVTAMDYTIAFYSEARASFFAWVTLERPETDEVFVWNASTTPEEARVFARLITRYASKWATDSVLPDLATSGDG